MISCHGTFTYSLLFTKKYSEKLSENVQIIAE